MQQELVNFCQFLYHVTPVVNFQVKIWLDLDFIDKKLVSTLLKCGLQLHSAFYLVIIQSFLSFPPIPRMSSTERRILLILEDFPLNFFEILKTQLNFV